MATPRSFKILFLLLVPCLASAQKYPDPDSPAVQTAAQAALRHAKVENIVGVTKGIEGVDSGITGATSGIQTVLQDLKAKVTAHEVKIELDADVLFDFDKYSLRAEAADSLREVGKVAKSYGKSPMLIEGHTDGKGAHPYNMKLSDNRAASVKKWLVENAGRLRVANNDSRLGRYQAGRSQQKSGWLRQSRRSSEKPARRDHDNYELNAMETIEIDLQQDGTRSAAIAPLPAETPKAPWRPRTAGLIAFFLVPSPEPFSHQPAPHGTPAKRQKVPASRARRGGSGVCDSGHLGSRRPQPVCGRRCRDRVSIYFPPSL